VLCLLARVEGKGCFIPNSEVTMADGSRRMLQSIQVGDKVASWDEANGKPAVSTVMAVPTFQRKHADLVEIQLPNASITATRDHPFWSHGRQTLVSLGPEQTKKEYDLDALLMEGSEELQGDNLESVRVTSILHHGEASAVAARALRGLGESVDGDVEVMTLCLEPHHWYYVHGVRVHNKGGCFVPSTEVTMADGGRKQIQEVKVGDHVKSWDEVEQKNIPAK
ncbi:unnamed protein product, partial [Polarella glacialis]